MAHVLVTGGSGFIASWCTLHLLDAGHTARVTVRNPARGTALREHLHAVADFEDSRLSVVEADLNRDTGWGKPSRAVTTRFTSLRPHCERRPSPEPR